MKIIPFEEKYRDDMIYMVLNAKNAIGRIPHINDDLLDIQANYFDKGHPFWVAIDDNDRVIGCIGTKCDEEGKSRCGDVIFSLQYLQPHAKMTTRDNIPCFLR